MSGPIRSATPGRDTLPFRVKFSYGAAEGANSLIFTIFYIFFLFFLTDVVKLNPAFAGLMLMLRTLWDACLDPVIGVWSDRLKLKWGRRRPFLLAVALPYGIIAWLLFTDFSLSPALTKIYFVALMLLHSVAFAVLEVPHLALGAEMTQDYNERTRLNAYRAAWSQVTSIAAGGLPLIMAGYFARIFNGPKVGWSITGAAFGMACVPLILLTWRFTRGYELFPERVSVRWRDIFESALKNRPFRFTIGMYTLAIAGMNVAGAVMVYFMNHVMKFSEQQSSFAFSLLFACTVVWVPLISVVSNKWGKRAAFFIFIGLWVLVQGVGIMVLQPGQKIFYYVLIFFASAGVVGVYMISWTIIPDVVEVDEFKTGERREGLYYGIISLIQKVGCALALWLVGQILEWVGYVPGQAQSPAALRGIIMLYGWGTALLLLGSMIFCWFMPMSREKHRLLREAIALKKAGKQPDTTGIQELLK